MIKIKNVTVNNYNQSNEDLKEVLSTVYFIKEHLVSQDLNDYVDDMNEVEEEQEERKPINVVKYEVDLEDASDVEYIEEQMVNVLKYISNNKVKLQSNFSRYNALLIAACASQGYITNIDEDGLITNSWRLTVSGLTHLQGE